MEGVALNFNRWSARKSLECPKTASHFGAHSQSRPLPSGKQGRVDHVQVFHFPGRRFCFARLGSQPCLRHVLGANDIDNDHYHRLRATIGSDPWICLKQGGAKLINIVEGSTRTYDTLKESDGRHTESMRPSMENVRAVLTRAYCKLSCPPTRLETTKRPMS